MRRLKSSFRKNSVFWIIIILICLMAFIYEFSGCIGENPFASAYVLENPSQAVFSSENGYYLTDSSYTIAVTDENNNFLYSIEGGDPENSFDYADAMAAGEGGILYVQDESYNDSGSFVYRNRILRFTENGRKREVLYEAETADEEGVQILHLDCLKIIDQVLYFSVITEDGIHVKRMNGTDVQECAFMPYENACRYVADSSFSNELEISAALKNGDVYSCRDGKTVQVYKAREHDTEEFWSLITEITYNDAGVLYLNDIGQRRILAIDEGQIRVAIDRSSTEDAALGGFAAYPLYKGLNISNGLISLLSIEYKCNSETGEANYFYGIAALDMEGKVLFYGNSIGISDARRVMTACVYIALFLTMVIAVFSMIKFIGVIRLAGGVQGKTQLLILLMAIVVTIGVSLTIFNSYNEKFANESAANLSNIAYLIEEKLDKNIVKSMNSPDAYFTEEYETLHEDVMSVLKSDVNKNSNVYAVIYKVYHNIICEVYRDTRSFGSIYPMAGEYKGSLEEEVSQTGERFVSQELELSEGSFTFVLIPTYDESGEVLALIEVGTDYNYFTQANNELYKKVLITAGIGVIVVMLLLSELMNGLSAFREKKKAAAEKCQYPPEVIRPIVFLMFFTANITTAFLPIYGMSLWNKDFPLPAEVAAAFPLSAELVLSALSTLICGFLVKKTGIKKMCICGAVFYIGGNLLSAFAGNLWILICANSTCGIGSGMLTIGINSWITGLESEESQNKGFVHYNAAFLSGMNCGTVIGSLIWENFGIKAAYMTAVGCAAVLGTLALLLIERRRAIIGEEQTKDKISLRYFITPGMIRYFICLSIPYLICASFLSYYFPIVAERNLLSAAEISMAFLISGVISIYAGSAIGEPVMERLGTQKTMVLASFIYAIALFYLVMNPSIVSCYVVIILFAIADSFGLAAQSVYFVSMPEVKRIGQSRALGINSTIESLASAGGSVIFGAALLLGDRTGILLIASVFAALFMLFVIGGKRNEKLDTSEAK